MAHKEINIFGTSFLDLLSGALAAVIILFVIVPKMSSQQQEALEEIQALNMQVEEIAELLEQNRNSIPQDVYDELTRRFEELQNTVSSLTSTIENQQQQLANAQSENRQLRQQLEESQAENQALQQRIEGLEQRLDEKDNNDISSGELFGLGEVELGIVITWTGASPDVDLYIKDLATDSVCYFGEKETSFGQLREDITTHKEGDDKYELFFQKKLKPGRYEILVADYVGPSADVNGYVVLHPGRRDQQRIEMPARELREVHLKVRVGILTVTETSITLQ